MKKNKQNNFETLTLLLGRPEQTRRPTTHAQAQPRLDVAQDSLPPLLQRLTMGPHESVSQIGEEEETAAQLVVGGSSGEVIGATVFASPMCI